MIGRTIALVALMASAAHASDIVGRARVIDGDSLVVGDTEVRLCGIDSVERGHRSYRAQTRALASLVKQQDVRCRPVDEGTPCDSRSKRTSYDRIVAQCFVAGRDIAAEMVRNGKACAWPRYSGKAYVGLGCVRKTR